MLRILLVAFLLSTGLTGMTQRDTFPRYLDDHLRFTKRNKAVYGALAIKKDDHWILYAVKPDTSMLLRISFKDRRLSIKDGPFTLYHSKSIKAQEGFFTDNLADGPWQSWYPNGKLKDSGSFYSNYFAGTWRHWYQNGQLMNQLECRTLDSLVAQPRETAAEEDIGILEGFRPSGTLNGAYTSWYENGNRESSGTLRNDSSDGEWTWLREDGTLCTRETYSQGKLIELSCYNEKGVYSGATCSIAKFPGLIHPFLTAEEYIIDQLHKSKFRDIKKEGTVQLQFTVTKSGQVTSLVVKHSADSVLSLHILKIFATLPAWSPAVSHNRPVDYVMELSIPFYRRD